MRIPTRWCGASESQVELLSVRPYLLGLVVGEWTETILPQFQIHVLLRPYRLEIRE